MIEILLIIVLLPIACSIVFYTIGMILTALFTIGDIIDEFLHDIFKW